MPNLTSRGLFKCSKKGCFPFLFVCWMGSFHWRTSTSLLSSNGEGEENFLFVNYLKCTHFLCAEWVAFIGKPPRPCFLAMERAKETFFLWIICSAPIFFLLCFYLCSKGPCIWAINQEKGKYSKHRVFSWPPVLCLSQFGVRYCGVRRFVLFKQFMNSIGHWSTVHSVRLS